jgi:hypothetical protein
MKAILPFVAGEAACAAGALDDVGTPIATTTAATHASKRTAGLGT